MEFVTILGHLIVLGIVGVVLTLFRRSDKNSKSLEQINRYATKRSEEFDAYVDEKIVELKDLSLGLEVQEKTGAVILNKIAGEVDALSDKIQHIEELNKKVTGYNSTMEKMLSLSQELDDRYGILKKDAVYVEGLDKRVKEGARKLLTVEKGIKEITSEFIKSNNSSIEKLKEHILEATTNEIRSLGESVSNSSHAVNNLNEKLEQIEDKFNSSSDDRLSLFKENLNTLVDGHKDNMIKISVDSKEAEESAFNSIKELIENRSHSLVETLESKIKMVEEDNQSKINKLSMDMGNVENVAKRIQEDNNTRLESIKEQLDKQLIMLKEANSVGVNSLQEEFSNSFMEFREFSLGQIEKVKGESQDLLEDIKDQFSEINGHRDDAKEKIANTEDYITREFKDLQDRVESSIFEITRDLSTQEESVKEEAIKHLENNIHLFKDEVDNKLEELTGVSSQIDQIKGELLTTLEATVKLCRDEVVEKVKELENIKDDSFKEYEDNIIDFKTRTNSRFSELEEVTKQVDDIKESVSNKINSTVDKIDHELSLVQNKQSEFNESYLELTSKISIGDEEIKEQILEHNTRLKDELFDSVSTSLESFREKFNLKLESFSDFESDINRAKEDLLDKLEQKHSDINENYNQFHQLISEKMAEDKSKLLEFIDDFSAQKESIENKINEIKEISYNNISEKLNLFEDEYFSKLKEKEDFIELETDRWKSKLESSVAEIKEESESSIINNMDSIHIKVNEFKERILADVSTFKESAVTQIEELLGALRDDEKNLLEESERSRIEIRDDIRVLKDELFNLQSDMTNSSEELRNRVSDISIEQERFVKETDIFSRADNLKEDLKGAVDQLTRQLVEVREKSGFVSTITTELEELRLLTSKVNTQIESVDNKKTVIDSLETRVSKVLELSDSVDDKLSRIKESEDQVVQVQLKLRGLKDLENEVNEELKRLENKQEILTETNKAIDSGFGHIQVIENKLDALKDNLIPFNNQIDNVKSKLQSVEERESKIDRAIDTLATLNDSMIDIESKIEKMDKAREWIAGVETRLNDSVRTANEQVKLMGALAQTKEDKKTESTGSSAPNMNMRDMVIKLAHNNWKPEDIARTTKLSRGEVELILELSPRK